MLKVLRVGRVLYEGFAAPWRRNSEDVGCDGGVEEGDEGKAHLGTPAEQVVRPEEL